MATIFGLKSMCMLLMLVFLSAFTSMVLSESFYKLPLPLHTRGPVSLAFDKAGGGPYVGTSDGRVLKYEGPGVGFVDFAATTPKSFTSRCQKNQNVTVVSAKGDMDPICGRPLGMEFNKLGNKLYIADAYNGLLVVGCNRLFLTLENHKRKARMVATTLVTSAEGVPFRLLNALDVDPQTGMVYFTDASSVYELRDLLKPVARHDATGRLMRYDPQTKEVTVLLRGLSLATGTAVSMDGSFVLVSEFTANRIKKFWLKGPKANTSEIINFSKGPPVNIKRTINGDFWIAVNRFETRMRHNKVVPFPVPIAVQIDSVGTVLKEVNIYNQYNYTSISEVQEVSGERYVGSPSADFVGVYKI